MRFEIAGAGSVAKQILIVLDNPPLERDVWTDEVFRAAGFAAVDNEAIADRLAEDATARKVLLEHAGDPLAHAEALAPYYRKAFAELYADAPRLGAYGAAWLVYAPLVDACIVDWSELERLASAPGVPQEDGEAFRQQNKAFIQRRAASYLEPGRLLELPSGLPLAERVSRTLTLLQRLGLR